MATDRFTSRIRLLVVLAGAALLIPGISAAQTWRTASFARQLGEETTLDVRVEYGAGKLQVRPADGSLLYRMQLRYDEDQFAPIADYDRADASLRLGLDSRERRDDHTMNVSDEATASIALARGVPLALRLEFGAGEADLELGGLAVRALDVSTGASQTHIRFGSPNRVAAENVNIQAGAAELRADGLGNSRAGRFRFQGGVGETTLDFGGIWTRDAAAVVQLGIGSVTLRFPRDLGIKLVRTGFLSSFSPNGLVKRDGAYYSRNWDRAEHQLTLDVTAAIGSVDVEWIN